MQSPGRSILCSRCGAAIELHTTALTSPCRSCGHVEPVPPGLIDEIRRYERQYAASIEDANASLRKAESLGKLAGQVPSSNLVFKLFGGMVVLALIVGGGVQYMLMNPSLSSEAKQTAMTIFPMVIMGVWLGIPILLMLRRSRKTASRVSAGAIHVACPTCGADNSLMAGNSAAACAYCASRLVPSATAVMRVLDAGALAQRHAGMTAMRAHRSMILSMRKASVNPAKYMFLSFGVPVVLGLGAFFVSSVLEGDGRTAVVSLLLMVAVALPVLLFFLWRNGRKTRWTSPILDLAQQFGGRYSTKLNDQVGWLNTYWADTYSDNWIVGVGYRFGTLAADVAGYPTLVDLHPDKPYSGGRYADTFRSRLNILVAAHIPLQAQSLGRLPSEAQVHVETIKNMGFMIKLTTSGILATAEPGLRKQFKRKPEHLHQLAQTLQSLTNLAAYLGPPASPMY